MSSFVTQALKKSGKFATRSDRPDLVRQGRFSYSVAGRPASYHPTIDGERAERFLRWDAL
jgi:hypothetical protein